MRGMNPRSLRAGRGGATSVNATISLPSRTRGKRCHVTGRSYFKTVRTHRSETDHTDHAPAVKDEAWDPQVQVTRSR